MDRHRALAPLLLLAVAIGGCGEPIDPAAKAAADARAVAQVRAMESGRPAPRPVTLEAIRFDDMEAHGLFDPGCAFAPGGSMGAVLLAQAKAGYVKVDGRVLRLAADPGSARLPVAGWSRYSGKAFAVRLQAEGEAAGERWPARLTITDGNDQVLYAAAGAVQCSA